MVLFLLIHFENIYKKIFPIISFSTQSNVVNPSILIPSLESVIEFKYVNDEKEFNIMRMKLWQMLKAIMEILRILYSTLSIMRQIPFVHPKDSTVCELKNTSRKIGKVSMFKVNEICYLF